MTTPDFILELRRHVGHAPLWLAGCTALVLRDGALRAGDAAAAPSPSPRVLMVRRADNGAWTPITGILEPGEEPARAAAREVAEETSVRARATRLLGVDVTGPRVYDNGDVARYLNLTFAMRYVDGEARPADGENSQAGWYPVDRLPETSPRFRELIRRALEPREGADFVA